MRRWTLNTIDFECAPGVAASRQWAELGYEPNRAQLAAKVQPCRCPVMPHLDKSAICGGLPPPARGHLPVRRPARLWGLRGWPQSPATLPKGIPTAAL